MLIPCMLASWFCYWFASVFPSLSNRTSRIICIVSPFVIAILLAVIVSSTFGDPFADFQIPDRPKWVVGGLLVTIAAVLVIPTLLLAFAAGNLRSRTESRENS
jgi:hypothetical protein